MTLSVSSGICISCEDAELFGAILIVDIVWKASVVKKGVGLQKSDCLYQQNPFSECCSDRCKKAIVISIKTPYMTMNISHTQTKLLSDSKFKFASNLQLSLTLPYSLVSS